MRQRTGSILCPSCRKLISIDEPRCPYCQALRPGLWGFAPALRKRLGAYADVVGILVAVCVAIFGLTLLLDPFAVQYASLMGFMSPSHRMLELFGMTGGISWRVGHWWTVFTYMFLHGSLLHIVFNMMWVVQLGRLCEEVFGNAWTFSLFVLSGVGGGIASNLFAAAVPTVGASGAVFGLLGALLVWGKRRGGSFGQGLSQQMWGYAIVLFLFGFAMGGVVNNTAHAGGFVTGFVVAWLLPLDRAERSGRPAVALALALGAAIVFGFVRSALVWLPILAG